MTLGECAVRIKEWFQIPDVRVYGDMQQVTAVFPCARARQRGGGSCAGPGRQVLIGGDFGHHEGLDCLEKHISVIDAGHHGLEHLFVDDMADFFAGHCPDIKIYKSKNVCPFRTV